MVKFLVLALLVLLGHVGWWIFCYNRINALPLPRRLIKAAELLIIALIGLIPIAMAIAHWPIVVALFRGQSVSTLPPLLVAWSVWSLGTVILLAPGWLESRFWLLPPRNLTALHVERLDVGQLISEPVTAGWLSNCLQRLPLNEITQLSITHKTIRLERDFFSSPWRALKIGHLSDLHFTGQLSPAYYRYVIDRMQALSPDLIAVTGDIIDKEHCLDWIEPILGRLSAPLGCYFLFGNHERRLQRPLAAAERLGELGWVDVGVRDAVIEPESVAPHLVGRPHVILCGNERPWFERHVGDCWQRGPLAAPDADRSLKLALSHSPDQHPWARELGVDLMLAGHTHGGQVRIPGIGPIIAPSRYGSRFASGVFRLPPMVMHVSRGLSGTQPLRWRCLPEISLLTVVPAHLAASSLPSQTASRALAH